MRVRRAPVGRAGGRPAVRRGLRECGAAEWIGIFAALEGELEAPRPV